MEFFFKDLKQSLRMFWRSPAGSPAKFMHWRGLSDVIQDVAAFNTGVVNYTGGDVPEQIRSGV